MAITTDGSSLGTRAQLGDTGDDDSSKTHDPSTHTPVVLQRLSMNNSPKTPLSPRSEISANGTVETTTVLTKTIAPVDDKIELTEETIQKEERAEIWTSLFTNNRAAANGLLLDYMPPQMLDGKPVVQLDKNEMNLEIQKWNSALIAYFIGVYLVQCPHKIHQSNLVQCSKT
ncbi:hypothetical protein KY284_032646 [Solanum tuberosum]|nr:hypothetical protein KY284_032646 [Solanum tuberosum]